jgi:hypothetical protein
LGAVTSRRLPVVSKTFNTEVTEEHRVKRFWLAFYVFGEHFFGVDFYEDAAAAGQDFIFFVKDFGGVDVLGAADFDFVAFYA